MLYITNIELKKFLERRGKLTINDSKFEIALAASGLTIGEVANRAGMSRQRLRVILNSKKITLQAAGKVARGLGVKVTEIID